MHTNIPPDRLEEIRTEGRIWADIDSPFVDPTRAAQATRILARRGRDWAESVLGRYYFGQSRVDPTLPALQKGEIEILVLADQAEPDAGGVR